MSTDDILRSIGVRFHLTQKQMNALSKEADGNRCTITDLLRRQVKMYVEGITEAWDGNPYEITSDRGDDQ